MHYCLKQFVAMLRTTNLKAGLEWFQSLFMIRLLQETAEAVRPWYAISLTPDLSRVLMRTSVRTTNRFNGFKEYFFARGSI